MDPDERIHGWSDREIMDQLRNLTGDTERDIEREALRRIMEKIEVDPKIKAGPH